MLLKDYKDFQQFYPFLIKFGSNSDHLASLQGGQVYFNNLDYFVQLERDAGMGGMGDKWEASAVINIETATIINCETQQPVLHISGGKAIVRYEYCLYRPVYCLFAVGPDMLEVIEENEEKMEVRLRFSDEQKEKIPKHFGEHAVVMSTDHFMDKIRAGVEKEGSAALAKLVSYSDYSINTDSRIRCFADESDDMFFWKDSSFKYQNEFRIVVMGEERHKPYIIDIGPIVDCSVLVSTQDLLDGKYGLSFRKKTAIEF